MMEGDICFDNAQAGGNPPCFDPSLTQPIYDYGHSFGAFGGFSVTGGYVYRGTALRSCIRGLYFFGDFTTENIWTLDPPNPSDGLIDVSSTVVHRNNDIPTNISSLNGSVRSRKTEPANFTSSATTMVRSIASNRSGPCRSETTTETNSLTPGTFQDSPTA